MNQKDILQLVSKSFGLYFILQAILYLHQIIGYIATTGFADADRSTYWTFGQILWTVIIYALFSCILIIKSGFVANALSRGSDNVKIAVSKSDLIEVVIIAIGIFMVANSIPEILNHVSQYLYFNEYEEENASLYWTRNGKKAEILFSIFNVAVGLVTMTNGRMIAKRLTRIGDRDDAIESQSTKD